MTLIKRESKKVIRIGLLNEIKISVRFALIDELNIGKNFSKTTKIELTKDDLYTISSELALVVCKLALNLYIQKKFIQTEKDEV